MDSNVLLLLLYFYYPLSHLCILNFHIHSLIWRPAIRGGQDVRLINPTLWVRVPLCLIILSYSTAPWSVRFLEQLVVPIYAVFVGLEYLKTRSNLKLCLITLKLGEIESLQ
jgi:hypothetical protein